MLPLSSVSAFLRAVEDLASQATPATDQAVATMRQVAESADQDLDAIAAGLGVEVVGANMFDLRCIGRAVGRAMGLESVSVS